MRQFLAELKRRNIYKVAVGYMFAAWALAQGLAQLLPVFDIPNWTVRLLIVLLILGFPVVLMLAWAFEITPEGLKRTEEVDPAQSIRRHTGRKIVAITIALGALALATTLFRLAPKQSISASSNTAGAPEIPPKSIAVLPFESLSEDKSNAYFADGIQDEILTRLSKIADLKVISRTSTQHYKSAPENLREIGSQLGVANIVEGSVQKSGDAVRVNVQLIKAANDSHLWADTFDRKLIDIFSVESEVA
jgi:TolB-like protein